MRRHGSDRARSTHLSKARRVADRRPAGTVPVVDAAPLSLTGFDPDTVAAWVGSLAVDELTLLAEICAQTLQDAVAAEGDLDALVEVGFSDGFESAGLAKLPWIVGGVLVVPGGRIDSMGGSHKCRFVAVGDDWVWQLEDRLADVMRPVERGLRTVTLVVAQPGLEFDVVTSTCRSGTHRRKSSERWRIDGTRLTLVERRGAGPGRDHR